METCTCGLYYGGILLLEDGESEQNKDINSTSKPKTKERSWQSKLQREEPKTPAGLESSFVQISSSILLQQLQHDFRNNILKDGKPVAVDNLNHQYCGSIDNPMIQIGVVPINLRGNQSSLLLRYQELLHMENFMKSSFDWCPLPIEIVNRYEISLSSKNCSSNVQNKLKDQSLD